MSLKKFGEKIKILRTAKNYTQERIADELNISHSAYAKIERGETDVNYSRIIELGTLFDIPPHELINFSDNSSLIFNFNNGGVNGNIGYSVGQQPNITLSNHKEEMDRMALEIKELKLLIHEFKKA